MKHGHFEISDWDEGIEGLGGREVIFQGACIASFYGDGLGSLNRAKEYIDLIEGKKEKEEDSGQEVVYIPDEGDTATCEEPEQEDSNGPFKINPNLISDSPHRYLRIKFFLGSTIEEIQRSLNAFLNNENICIGNFRDLKLWKEGSVYQVSLVYAELVT